MATSGVGFCHDANETNAEILAALLSDGYDYPQAYVDAFLFEPDSSVAQLPTTLWDLHSSFAAEMPFDPLHWDTDGNWVA